jgi:hypothetical protein
MRSFIPGWQEKQFCNSFWVYEQVSFSDQMTGLDGLALKRASQDPGIRPGPGTLELEQ